MDPHEIDLCRLLHRRARHGALAGAELQRYAVTLHRLFHRLLELQNERASERHRPRREVRIRRVFPVELCWGERTWRVTTLDLGFGGFSSLLEVAPRADDAVAVRVRLSKEAQLAVEARVVDVRERRGSARVSFAFCDLDRSDRALLQSFLVEDAVTDVAMAMARAPEPSRPAANDRASARREGAEGLLGSGT